MRTRLKLGQWNAICDRCGFKFKSGELKKDWQGLMVCNEDFELRNPQDFLRIQPERVVPDWVRPRPPDIFIENLGLFDVMAVSDGDSEYVEAGYFLETYIENGFVSQVSFIRDFSDSLEILDTTTTTRISNFSSFVTLTDTFSKQTGGDASFSDALSLSEEVTTTLQKTASFVDTVTVTETFAKTQNTIRNIPDSLSLGDTINPFSVNKNISDSIPLTETLSRTFSATRAVSDTIPLEDSGSGYINDYVETTYFSEFYVGTPTYF